MKTGRMSAAVVGMLLYGSAHTAPAASAESVEGFAAGTTLFGLLRETRDRTPVLPPRPVDFNETRRPADERVLSFDEPLQPAILARLHYAFGSDPGPSIDRVSQGNPEVLLRNSDALVRTKVRMPLGRKWRGFVYVDMGAADSALRWQGLAGIQGGHGFDLLGGWRRVTYHFGPGMGFDSLDFNGPFVGATLAW
jgi:hypothetical protein